MHFLNGLLIASTLLPTAIMLAVGVLVVAFFVGYKKGVRKIGWKSLACLFATLLYHPVFSFFEGTTKLDLQNKNVAGIAIVVCASVVWIAYTLVGVIAKGIERAIDLRNFKRRNGGAMLEYESDYSEYDRMLSGKYVELQRAKPGFFERVFGGFGCVFNLVVWFISIIVVALYIVSETKWYANLENVYTMSVLNGITVYDLIRTGMIFVCIKLLFIFGCIAYERGLFGVIRGICVRLGAVIPLLISVYLVFVLSQEVESLASLVLSVSEWFENAALLSRYADLLSKSVVSAVLFLPLLIVSAIFNYVLGLVARGIRKYKPLRILDGLLGVFALFTVAVLVFVFI